MKTMGFPCNLSQQSIDPKIARNLLAFALHLRLPSTPLSPPSHRSCRWFRYASRACGKVLLCSLDSSWSLELLLERRSSSSSGGWVWKPMIMIIYGKSMDNLWIIMMISMDNHDDIYGISIDIMIWLLVFHLPLWKRLDFVNGDDYSIPNWMDKQNSCSKPPTKIEHI